MKILWYGAAALGMILAVLSGLDGDWVKSNVHMLGVLLIYIILRLEDLTESK